MSSEIYASSSKAQQILGDLEATKNVVGGIVNKKLEEQQATEAKTAQIAEQFKVDSATAYKFQRTKSAPSLGSRAWIWFSGIGNSIVNFFRSLFCCSPSKPERSKQN